MSGTLRKLAVAATGAVLVMASAGQLAPANAQIESAELPLKPARQLQFDTSEGTWLSLDLSPDGRRIVFDLLGDLYTLDSRGGTATRITSGVAFDAQPVFAPDGERLAFVSDRSGSENLWAAAADGTGARRITTLEDDTVLTSPVWSADGASIFVSRYRPDLDGFELWRFPASGGGPGQLLVPIKASPDQPRDSWTSATGAAPSSDGRFLYYAAHVGDLDSDRLPEWTIRRRDLGTGAEETLISAPRSPRPDLIQGTAFSPVVSPDGRLLVYGTRANGRTGLRMLDLGTREDRWLAYPLETQDELMASGWRGFLPRFVFTADSRSLLINDAGCINRLDLATSRMTPIEFKAEVAVPLGPDLRVDIKEETGPVRARLIQTPEQSPDGRRLAFSALGHVYVMPLDGQSKPRRLTRGTTPEFHPSWSPDGRTVTYVTWTAKDGGHVWSVPADGRGTPRRLTAVPAFYTSPAFAPDGRSVFALRSSNSVRMHSYMEFGPLRDAELVEIDPAAKPGRGRVVASGTMGGRPHFGRKSDEVFLNFDDGLNAVARDGSGRRPVLKVSGPGWYFVEGAVPVDDLKISPDGRRALAQVAQQLHLIDLTKSGGDTVDLTRPGTAHRKITDVGADFFAWADGGRTITWSVGSTFYRRPLDGDDAAAFRAVVEVPRDVPKGALVLRGATAITMGPGGVIKNADIVVIDNRIAAVGVRGQVDVPAGANVRDVSGKFIVPGFIESHVHVADVRRDVLDLEAWGPLANLAYGVTTAFDPSSLTIDMLAYQDLIDAGLMLGSRLPSTGPALFSFNRFGTKDEVRAVLRRYRDHYRTRNIKQYRTGNRRVRQWVAEASRELGMMPTAEGALSMKLSLSQVMDGFTGQEHALTAVPLYRDVVELMVKSGAAYTTTLQITNGGPEGQDFFIVRDHPRDDAKLNRFAPRFVVDVKTQQRTWRELSQYLFPRIASGAAQIARAGGVVAMGSHGEMPGPAFHWEMEAHVMGGMTPLEALRAGTLGSAQAIGRGSEFGSLEAGKYADLVILDGDPLAKISNTLAIDAVMKNGRLHDGRTMDELWPRRRPLPPRWHWTDRAPGIPQPQPTSEILHSH